MIYVNYTKNEVVYNFAFDNDKIPPTFQQDQDFLGCSNPMLIADGSTYDKLKTALPHMIPIVKNQRCYLFGDIAKMAYCILQFCEV